jgi:coenzyme PQQ biosynthesis protein PqqD
MSAIPETAVPALARGVRLHTDAVTGEPVLLFPEGVLFLNATAHDVVRRCDGTATVDAIVCALAGEYETEPGALRRDVLECLSELQQRRLLSFHP